jgi:hypothetical protein
VLVHEQRSAVRELGGRLVEEGHLDMADQLFMLTSTELENLYRANQLPDMTERARMHFYDHCAPTKYA